jgi:hypothetical protein
LGKILVPDLPLAVTLDSSLIELTYGFNSGEVKILRFEYFLKDSLELEKIFNVASTQLKQGCKKFYDVRFGLEDKTDYGNGIELSYSNNSKKLKKINLYKMTNLTATKSLLIEYEAAE